MESGAIKVRKEVLEQLCGFMLLFMVFLVAKYGVPQVIAAEAAKSGGDAATAGGGEEQEESKEDKEKE